MTNGFFYFLTDPSGRDDSIPIMVLSQGSETPTFTGFFPTWDRTLWTVSDAL